MSKSHFVAQLCSRQVTFMLKTSVSSKTGKTLREQFSFSHFVRTRKVRNFSFFRFNLFRKKNRNFHVKRNATIS